jgi:hypothetical protein
MVLTVELYEGHGVHKTVGQYTQEDESPTSTLCEMNQIHSPMIQRYSSFGEYRFLGNYSANATQQMLPH